jgi:release factor glutamine methyltransferase
MEQTKTTWHVLELLKVTEKLLKEKNIENARLNAELLLSDTLKMPRIKLYLDFEKPLKENEISEYRTKIRRRLNHEPLQYILGYAEFYGLRFGITPEVLIPRPETELLVEKAVESISSFEMINPKILEIGTGSGCISIAVASKVNCTIDAIEISEESLNIARKNSESNGTTSKINFLNKNILTDYTSFNGYDIALCNPPYVPKNEFETLQAEIKKFEPRSALTDEGDGLSYYRKIFGLFKETSAGIKIFMELGDGKKDEVEKLLKSSRISNYDIYKDYHGIERVLYINK